MTKNGKKRVFVNNTFFDNTLKTVFNYDECNNIFLTNLREFDFF